MTFEKVKYTNTWWEKKLYKNYISTTSSFSKVPSSTFNSLLKIASIPISSTNLKGICNQFRVIQPTVSHKNKFIKVFDCKWHLLNVKLIIILTRKKYLYFNLWFNNPQDLIGGESNNKKHSFMFLPPLENTFDVFDIKLILPKNQ